ncbi:MAG: glutamate racemase [Acidimicrobiia bacterium]
MPPQIAVLDSGIGGTGVLNEIRRRRPWADLVYVADHAFGPYGERTLEEVRTRTELLARYLESAGVELVVIACNSASAASLYYLRETMPHMTFVGMEPAVKPAAGLTKTGVVGVMATAATFQGELFRSLVGRYGGDTAVVEQPCPGLAAAIEAGDDVAPMLDKYLKPLIDADADVIVLGCTHYPLVREQIESRLGPAVELVDPAASVASRAIEVADELGIESSGIGDVQWLSTATASGEPDPEWDRIGIPALAIGAIAVGDVTLSAIEGDVTTLRVDAIVNAANVELEHGGGVAQAIATAGGPSITEESATWVDTHGPLQPGVAALTTAGAMPSSYVIHVAGPIFASEQDNELLLSAATLAALDMAEEIEARTMAIPAISAGIYGYPPDEATRVITETVAEQLSSGSTLQSVFLVGYDDAMPLRFGSAIRDLLGDD